MVGGGVHLESWVVNLSPFLNVQEITAGPDMPRLTTCFPGCVVAACCYPRFGDAGVREQVRVDPASARCETSAVEGELPEVSLDNFTRGDSDANGTCQWDLVSAAPSSSRR